jgi:uncharacterized protein YdbL (DUF1318 family)
MRVDKIVGLAFGVGLMALIASSPAWGDAAEIKQRMKERLPAIEELKDKGLVGENNQGYLEFVADKTAAAGVVEAENADRRTIYEAIAKQQGVGVELVGQRRAAQIAEIAGPGEWLQGQDGKWYQK